MSAVSSTTLTVVARGVLCYAEHLRGLKAWEALQAKGIATNEVLRATLEEVGRIERLDRLNKARERFVYPDGFRRVYH